MFSIFSSHLFSFNYRIFVLVLQLSVRTSWTIVFATFKQHSISKDLAVNKVKHFAVNLFSETFFSRFIYDFETDDSLISFFITAEFEELIVQV